MSGIWTNASPQSKASFSQPHIRQPSITEWFKAQPEPEAISSHPESTSPDFESSAVITDPSLKLDNISSAEATIERVQELLPPTLESLEQHASRELPRKKNKNNKKSKVSNWFMKKTLTPANKARTKKQRQKYEPGDNDREVSCIVKLTLAEATRSPTNITVPKSFGHARSIYQTMYGYSPLCGHACGQRADLTG